MPEACVRPAAILAVRRLYLVRFLFLVGPARMRPPGCSPTPTSGSSSTGGLGGSGGSCRAKNVQGGTVGGPVSGHQQSAASVAESKRGDTGMVSGQATVPARLRGRDRRTVERRGAGTADNARPAAAIPREQPRAPGQRAERATSLDGHAMGRSSGRDGRAPRRTARTPDPRVGRGTRTFPRNHLAGLRHSQHPGQSEGLLPGSVHPARSPAGSTGSGPPRRGTACVDP